jgi:hypothetical protein
VSQHQQPLSPAAQLDLGSALLLQLQLLVQVFGWMLTLTSLLVKLPFWLDVLQLGGSQLKQPLLRLNPDSRWIMLHKETYITWQLFDLKG